MWVKKLPKSKQKLFESTPSFEVDFPELTYPDNEITKVTQMYKNSKLSEKEKRDLDKNNNKMLIKIVGEDKSDWEDFIKDIDIHTIKLKMKYGRKRPYEVSDEIDSQTDTDNSPSFPSGHAIEAYALAKVLGNKYPDKQKDLNNMAQRIALSRVQMGNHYPSDIKAGEKVGNLIADKYLSINKSWQNILVKDWGESEKKSEIEKGKIKDTLYRWFNRRGGKETKDSKSQKGWIACETCDNKNGPKPCGRPDASKGTKRSCKPTCGAC